MSNTNKDRGPGQRGGDNKPEKKNDLKIQLSNHNKMAAYTQKNTFSAATTLPPPDNRLYIASNINKNKPPLWIKNQPTDPSQGVRSSLMDDAPGNDPSSFEKDHFAKLQMPGLAEMNLGASGHHDSSGHSGTAFKCRKCGIPGHFEFNCMNNLQAPAITALSSVPAVLQTRELLEYNLEALRLKKEELKIEKKQKRAEKRARKEEKKKRKESKKKDKEHKAKKEKKKLTREISSDSRNDKRGDKGEIKESTKESKDRERTKPGKVVRDRSESPPQKQSKQAENVKDVKRSTKEDRSLSHQTSISSTSSDSESGSSESAKQKHGNKQTHEDRHKKDERRNRSRERSKERKDRKDRR